MDIKGINSWLENLAIASEKAGDEDKKQKTVYVKIAAQYRGLKDFNLKDKFTIGGSLLGNSPIMRYIEENNLQYDVKRENGQYTITKL